MVSASEGGYGKADKGGCVKFLLQIRSKGGGGQNPKILWTSHLEASYGLDSGVFRIAMRDNDEPE